MRHVQFGLARAWIALHLQQLYFCVTEEREALFTVKLERITAMATYETSRAAPFGAITVFRMVQALGNTATALQSWNSARITRKALSKLSNRELDDIGLCRGDIDLIGR